MTMRVRGVLMLVAGLAVMGLASCGHYNCSSGATFGNSSCTASGGGLGSGGGGGSATAAFVFVADADRHGNNRHDRWLHSEHDRVNFRGYPQLYSACDPAK